LEASQSQQWYSMAWSPNSRKIVTCGRKSDGPTIQFWDVESLDQVGSLPTEGQGKPVLHVAWSPQGPRLATANADQTVDIWDTNTSERIHELRGHNGPVQRIAWSSDGERLASASQDHTVRLWGVESGDQLRTLYGHLGNVDELGFSPDGRYLVSFDFFGEGGIKLWNLAEDANLELGDGKQSFNHATPSRNGEYIATAPDDRVVDVWDAISGVRLRTLSLPHDRPLQMRSNQSPGYLAWSPDGRKIAWADKDDIRIWDTLTSDDVRSISAPIDRVQRDADAHRIDEIAWSVDGQAIAAALDTDIAIFDAADGEASRFIHAHEMQITALAWGPHGRLASGSRDGTVRIWNALDGELLFALPHVDQNSSRRSEISVLAWSPDGEKLVSSAQLDHGLKIWNATVGTVHCSMLGHNGEIYSLAWHPSGKRLASYAGDHTVRLWEPDGGREIVNLETTPQRQGAIVWSADGKRLVLASRHGQTQTWNASLGFQRENRPTTHVRVSHQTELAELLNRLSVNEMAEQELSQMIKEQPTLWEPLVARGKLHARQKRWDEAADDFARAIDLSEDRGSMWNSPHMRICRLLPQWHEVFSRVVQRRPEQATIWVARGQYHVLNSQWSEALPDYIRGLTPPKAHSNTLQYAALLVFLDERERYEQLCKQFAAQQANTPYIFVIGSAKTVEPQQCVQWIHANIAESERAWPENLHVLALAYYRAGQYEQAVDYVKKSQSLSREMSWHFNARNWLVLAMGRQQLGQIQKARECLKKVQQIIEEHGPKQGESAQASPLGWIQIHNLSREAEELLGRDRRSQSGEESADESAPKKADGDSG
ncbi:MAG: eIF2A-related protein, partial [Aeoliella sp.]